MGSARELHPKTARASSLNRERFIPLRGSSRESFIPKTRAFQARFPQEAGVVALMLRSAELGAVTTA